MYQPSPPEPASEGTPGRSCCLGLLAVFGLLVFGLPVAVSAAAANDGTGDTTLLVFAGGMALTGGVLVVGLVLWGYLMAVWKGRPRP